MKVTTLKIDMFDYVHKGSTEHSEPNQGETEDVVMDSVTVV